MSSRTGRHAFRPNPRLQTIEGIYSGKGRQAAIVEVHSVIRKDSTLWVRALDGEYHRVRTPNPGVLDDLERHLIANKGRPVQVVLHRVGDPLRDGATPAVWGPWVG